MPGQRRKSKPKLPFKPFDVTTKQLVEIDPAAWVAYVGLHQDPARIIDADLSTVAVEADKVIRVEAVRPYLLNLEFQSGYEADLGDRVLLYSVLLRRRHGLRVKSVVLLLRPEADGVGMTGRIEDLAEDAADRDFEHIFRYRVVRVWQQPVESLLTGRLVTLPLAPLGAVEPGQLPAVIGRMRDRLEAEARAGLRKELWGATFLLLGLRYEAGFIEQLLKGVQGMEESTTYQLLLSRGRAEGEARGEAKGEMKEARKLLLRLGSKRLGEPEAEVLAWLEQASLEQLEAMADRLLQAETWQELL
jgi:hypothetical protein